MKELIQSLFFLTGVLFIKPAMAQTFQGAETTKAHYKVLYFLDNVVLKKIKGTLTNIDNVCQDVCLKGSVEVEPVAFGDYVAVFDKLNPYQFALATFVQKINIAEIAGFVAAILIGLSLGLIGGGGSILTVPIFVYLFRINAIIATTYSLFVVGLTSSAGAISHYRKGNVNFKIAFLFGIPSLIAVFIMRKWVRPALPNHLLNIGAFELTKSVLLMLVFAVLMLAASISMIRKKKEVLVFELPLSYIKLTIQSIVVGIITGFVGVGGGFLIIPSLVLFAGLPMKKAVGTSLTVMTISSLLGVLGDVSIHVPINYTFLMLFSVFSIAGIIAGSYLTKYITDTKLKPAFGWFVLLMGIFVLITTLTK
jgi:hypothetical protein